MQNAEFIKAVESRLTAAVGTIIAQSVMKNNLAKLNKDVQSLTADDRVLLIGNIVKAVSLFETKNESTVLKSELENLLKTSS